MRNPFPQIGKVIKYDFKYSSRILLPLFGALILLGLLIGLSINPEKMFADTTNTVYESSSVLQLNGEEADFVQPVVTAAEQKIRNTITGLLIFAYELVHIVAVIMTLVEISKRFQKSMLGEEAYLNLTLPVTMGEHLWGKTITALIWMIMSGVATLIAGILTFIRLYGTFFDFIEWEDIVEILNEINMTFGGIVGLTILTYLVVSIWLIQFFYIVSTVSHAVSKHRALVRFGMIVGLIYINGCIFRTFPSSNLDEFSSAAGPIITKYILLFNLVMFCVSAIYFAINQLIFTKKLNLD